VEIGELMLVGEGNVSQAVRCYEGRMIINTYMYKDMDICIEKCIEIDAHMKIISVFRALQTI
jgi:hypothetical protein